MFQTQTYSISLIDVVKTRKMSTWGNASRSLSRVISELPVEKRESYHLTLDPGISHKIGRRHGVKLKQNCWYLKSDKEFISRAYCPIPSIARLSCRPTNKTSKYFRSVLLPLLTCCSEVIILQLVGNQAHQ